MERAFSSFPEPFTPDDIEAELEHSDPELFSYFRRLPKELWKRHFLVLEKIAQDSKEAPEVLEQQRKRYMEIILEAREKAIVECIASDTALQEAWAKSPEVVDALGGQLRETLTAEGNLLGAGQTARIKRMTVEGIDRSIAVKYLLTPTSKTLSVDAEHDMLREVEIITEIEAAEGRIGVGERIRVPHPYFFYKRGALQCYGMHEVQGVNLETIFNSRSMHIDLQDRVLDGLRKRYGTPEAQEALWKELDSFVTAMHEVCLHGDVKDRNIMVDVDGVFHLIDFGQSIAMRTESEKTRSQFEDLKDQERSAMHSRIRALLLLALNTGGRE